MNYEPKYVRMKYTIKEKDQDARKERGLLLIIFYCVLSFLLRLLQLWENLNDNVIFASVTFLVGLCLLISSYGIWYLRLWGYYGVQIMTFANLVLMDLVWPIFAILFPDAGFPPDFRISTVVVSIVLTVLVMGFLYSKRELFFNE